MRKDDPSDLASDRHLSEESAIGVAMGAEPNADEALHLEHCSVCSARVSQMRTIAADGRAALSPLAEVPPLDPATSARILEGVARQAAAAPWWPAALLALGLTVAASALGARAALTSSLAELGLPLATLAMACTVALASRTRSAGRFAIASVLASLTLGLLDAHRADVLHADVGARCLGIELALGAIAAGVTYASGAAQRRPDALAAAAGAGALAGQAALMVACHAPGALLHGLAFHTLGVALAVALGHSSRWVLTTR